MRRCWECGEQGATALLAENCVSQRRAAAAAMATEWRRDDRQISLLFLFLSFSFFSFFSFRLFPSLQSLVEDSIPLTLYNTQSINNQQPTMSDYPEDVRKSCSAFVSALSIVSPSIPSELMMTFVALPCLFVSPQARWNTYALFFPSILPLIPERTSHPVRSSPPRHPNSRHALQGRS